MAIVEWKAKYVLWQLEFSSAMCPLFFDSHRLKTFFSVNHHSFVSHSLRSWFHYSLIKEVAYDELPTLLHITSSLTRPHLALGCPGAVLFPSLSQASLVYNHNLFTYTFPISQIWCSKYLSPMSTPRII